MTMVEVLADITSRIVREFHPVQVVLFGSQARGEAGASSDVDLLVVLPACRDKRRDTGALHEALSAVSVSKDIVVTTPEEIRRIGNMIGTVLRPALQEGKVLYDNGENDGLRCGPVSEDDVVAATRRWLRQARDDLAGASALLREGMPGLAYYHAQQAAEKAIKTALVRLQIDFPLTHDLRALLSLVPQEWEVTNIFVSPRELGEWALAGRYPVENLPDPDEEAGPGGGPPGPRGAGSGYPRPAGPWA